MPTPADYFGTDEFDDYPVIRPKDTTPIPNDVYVVGVDDSSVVTLNLDDLAADPIPVETAAPVKRKLTQAEKFKPKDPINRPARRPDVQDISPDIDIVWFPDGSYEATTLPPLTMPITVKPEGCTDLGWEMYKAYMDLRLKKVRSRFADFVYTPDGVYLKAHPSFTEVEE